MTLSDEGQVTIHQQPNSHEEHNHNGPLVVLFVFVGLLLGGLLRQINKKTKIPYTPMLLILGIILGYFKQSLGVLGQSTSIIQQLNPHMILLIFIPVLIFESAFNCDWHVFRKSMLNILILAGPGVLWGAIMIGVCFKVILFYPEQQLTWYQAFTLGCVLSATDPVAVVALLKELGASVRFNTLVEGESLLNDGTAMVFFMLFMDLAKGNTSSVTGVLGNFVRVSLGGPLLGLLVGALISYWIKRIIRDSVLSVNATFVGAFLCFYIAEFTWVKVSGILSIVTLGLYMSAVGKRKIYPESEHDLHSVWSYIQYSCETLIFVLTGIVVGVKMIQESTITGWDWLKMLMFWVLMIAVRAIMVITFLPILKASGYGVTKKEIIVLIYGGLRGALGLCLSLMVGVDESLPVRFREITVFYMCGMAFLTIVVNGFTCGKLVDYVEMIHYPEIKKKLFRRCVKTVLESTQLKLKEIQQQPDLAYAKWKDVQKFANVRQLGETEFQRRKTEKGINSRTSLRDSLVDVKKNEMLQQIRFQFTRYLRKVFWELYEAGEVSEEAIKSLSDCCDIINDATTQPLNYFQVLSSRFSMETVKFYMYLKNFAIIGPFVNRLLISKIYYVYEVTALFLEACEETEHAFHNSFPLNTEYLKMILEEVKQNQQSATTYLSELQTNYPQIIQAVHTSRAATILLNHKKIKLQDLYEEGFVDKSEFDTLRKQIDRGLVALQFNEFKTEEIRFNEVLTDCPLFSNLTRDQIVKIRMKSTQKTFQKGKKIIEKGESINSVFIIVSGNVKEQYDDFYFIRGLGNILNPYDFTYNEPSKCTIRAKTTTKIMEVKADIILGLLESEPEFKLKWFKSIFMYSVRHKQSLQLLEKHFSEKELRRFVESAEMKLLKEGDSEMVQHGGYVFEGEVMSEGTKYTKEQFISKEKAVKALNDVVLLKFKTIAGIQFKNQDRISVFNRNE